jgi:hypothetical protein
LNPRLNPFAFLVFNVRSSSNRFQFSVGVHKPWP